MKKYFITYQYNDGEYHSQNIFKDDILEIDKFDPITIKHVLLNKMNSHPGRHNKLGDWQLHLINWYEIQ